jgi:MFS family permease
MMGVGAVVSALTVAQGRNMRLQHVIGGAAALGVTMLLLTVTPSTLVAIPVVIAIGMASILYNTATTAHVQLATESYIRGRVLALQTVLLIGSAPIGGPLLGWTADHFGGRVPMLIGGVSCLVAALFGTIASRRFHETEPQPAAELEPIADTSDKLQ